MKILIHYGYAKTGTTSIQIALAKKRKMLMQHGVYYPKIVKPTTSHHLLQALFRSKEETAPYLIAECGGYDNMMKLANRSWRKIKQETARKNPKALILSSEMFFGDETGFGQNKFREMLSELSDDIQPIIYIRDPAERYLSNLQQSSRNSGVVRSPSAELIRKNIEHLESVFDRKLQIRAFQRDQLIDGDIVKDFVSSYLSDYFDPSLIPTTRANESISAEAMEISVNFRRVVWPNDNRVSFPKSRKLLSEVERVENTYTTVNKPILRYGIVNQIQRASIDYIWLKDKYEVSFDTMDYAKIDGVPVPYSTEYKNLSGIIHIDWVQYNKIIYSILSREMDASKERELVIGKYNIKVSNISKNIQQLRKQALRLIGR